MLADIAWGFRRKRQGDRELQRQFRLQDERREAEHQRSLREISQYKHILDRSYFRYLYPGSTHLYAGLGR